MQYPFAAIFTWAAQDSPLNIDKLWRNEGVYNFGRLSRGKGEEEIEKYGKETQKAGMGGRTSSSCGSIINKWLKTILKI